MPRTIAVLFQVSVMDHNPVECDRATETSLRYHHLSCVLQSCSSSDHILHHPSPLHLFSYSMFSWYKDEEDQVVIWNLWSQGGGCSLWRNLLLLQIVERWLERLTAKAPNSDSDSSYCWR